MTSLLPWMRLYCRQIDRSGAPRSERTRSRTAGLDVDVDKEEMKEESLGAAPGRPSAQLCRSLIVVAGRRSTIWFRFSSRERALLLNIVQLVALLHADRPSSPAAAAAAAAAARAANSPNLRRSRRLRGGRDDSAKVTTAVV